MKKVCLILDPSGVKFKPLTLILGEIDSEIEPVWLAGFKALPDWLKKNLEPPKEESKSPPADQEGKESEEGETFEPVCVPLIIVDQLMVKAEHINLLASIQKYLKSKGCGPEIGLTKILLSARESDEFSIEDKLHPIFQNILYYPFDAIISRNRLLWAIKGKESVTSEGLNSLPAMSTVEIVKRVHVERVSEIGFRTVNDSDLPPGRVAKYYGGIFGDDLYSGSFAISTKTTEHPNPGLKYLTSFAFWGISTDLIKTVRRRVRAHANFQSLPFPRNATREVQNFTFVVVHSDDGVTARIQEPLERTFRNTKVVRYSSLKDFLVRVDLSLAFSSEDPPSELWPFGDESEFQMTYNEGGEVFLGEIEPKLESDQFLLGTPANDLEKLRNKILQCCRNEQRNLFLKCWRGEEKMPETGITVLVNHNGVSEFVTFYKSELLSREENGVMVQRRKIKIRRSRESDVEHFAKDEASEEKPTLPDGMIGLFVEDRFVKERSPDFWRLIKRKITELEKVSSTQSNVHLYSIGQRPIASYEDRDRLSGFADHFVEPIDTYYFLRAVNHAHLQLIPSGDNLGRDYYDEASVFMAATPVEVVRLSEVSLTIRYGRKLVETEFRRFLLWDSDGKVIPELPGKCIDSEPDPERAGEFLVHFVFFGLRDQHLQEVRRWLMDQYNLLKKAEEQQEGKTS